MSMKALTDLLDVAASWAGPGVSRWVLLAVLFVPFAACGDGAAPQAGIGGVEQAISETSSAGHEEPLFSEPAAEGDTLALVGAPAKRTRTIAAMMFDIGLGPPDKAKIETLLTGETQSLRRMYNEISFGIQDISVEMLGPYKLPQPTCLKIECCGPKPSQANGPEVADIIAQLPKKYDHYFWVYGPIPAGAACGTWGDEGSPDKPAVYSSYSFHGLVGYSQEIGHNFGMTHEPFMNCNGKTLLDDTTQCTHKEYGSTLSFMGSAALHPSAYHKNQQGWLTKCNVVKVGASAKFTLLPNEVACDGAQLLQVAAPKTRPAPAKGDRQGSAPMLTHYYVELRTPSGFDSKLKPEVVIYLGPDLPTSSRAAPYVYLLDQTPATTSLTDSGLSAAGQSFVDPAGGLTITVDAIDAKSATVSVTTMGGQGDATCADGTTFAAPGPGATSCGALSTVDGGSSGSGGGSGSEAGATDGSGGRMPDATSGTTLGAGGSAAGSGGNGGMVGQAGGATTHEDTTGHNAGAAAPESGVEGGCSCSVLRLSRTNAPFNAWLLLAGVLGGRFVRRRHSRV
jgi:hypothetical protein